MPIYNPITKELIQDDLGGTTGGDGFLRSADAHLTMSYNDVANTLTLQVVNNITIAPTGIEFGLAAQEYDITGTTLVSAVAGGALGGIPDEASVGHKLADCLTAISSARDGAYLLVQEKGGAASPTNPLTVQFLFTGMTAFDTIESRCRYDGSVAHNMSLQLWNYVTGGGQWDTYDSFSDEADYTERTIHVSSPALYISGGAAKLQFIHTTSGTAGHSILFDLVSLNDGGGGGSSTVASGVAFTPASGVVATNVQAAIEEVGIVAHAAVTVTAPISLSGQLVGLMNDTAAAITQIDTGALSNLDTDIPTSKAVATAIAAGGGGMSPSLAIAYAIALG